MESILEVMAPVRTTGNTVAQGTVVSATRTLGAEGKHGEDTGRAGQSHRQWRPLECVGLSSILMEPKDERTE